MMETTGCPTAVNCPACATSLDAQPSTGARILVYESCKRAKSNVACALCTRAWAKAAFASAEAICGSTGAVWLKRPWASFTRVSALRRASWAKASCARVWASAAWLPS